MSYCFLFGPVGVWVSHCIEGKTRHSDRESGTRVDIRRVEYTEGHREGNGGFVMPPMAQPVDKVAIWRADLLFEIEPPTLAPHHHYHPEFNANGPCLRVDDADLMADPVGWTVDKLRNLDVLLRASAASELVDEVDMDEVARALPAMVSAIEDCMSRVPTLEQLR